MPIYELACHQCEVVFEVRCSYEDRGRTPCPSCLGATSPLISGVKLIGATPSRPIDFPQLGRSFETNSEYRSYLKTAGVKEVSKSSPEYRSMMDRLSTRRDNNAKKLGYRDIHHQQTDWNKTNKKQT